MKASFPLAGGTENAALDSFAFAGDGRYCAPSLYGNAKSDICSMASKFVFQISIKGFDELMDDL